jgi:DNA polymerase III delta prime subunit
MLEYPWINKYRPRSISDLVLSESDKTILRGFIENPDKIPPSVLFYGPPGTGKTTVNSIIQKACEQKGYKVIEIFGSVTNGIDFVRNTIIPACSTKGRKYIRIEEFDRFTRESQMALRNIMGEDKYSHVSFLLTANELWRIHEAIQSRSVCIKFDAPDKNACVSKLKFILDSENIKYDESNISTYLQRIVDTFYPRIRDMVSLIQVLSNNGEFNYDISSLSAKDETIKSIYMFDKLFSTGVVDMKELVKISSSVKLQSFYEIIHDKYLNAGFVEISIKCREKIATLNQTLSPELEFISFFKWARDEYIPHLLNRVR